MTARGELRDELLKRVFATDLLNCVCGGRRTVVAVITDAAAARAAIDMPDRGLVVANCATDPLRGAITVGSDGSYEFTVTGVKAGTDSSGPRSVAGSRAAISADRAYPSRKLLQYCNGAPFARACANMAAA